MAGVLVDSCVLLDLFTDDPVWAEWSEDILELYSRTCILYINPIIYTEISIGFNAFDEVEKAVSELGVVSLEIPRKALFLAGKTFLEYRKNRGTKTSPLPDFFIGAHAATSALELITRDTSRYQSYFPGVKLIVPQT